MQAPTSISEIDSALLEVDYRLLHIEERSLYETRFSEFARRAWAEIEPGRRVIWSWHLDLLCRFLEDFRKRRFRNGIINIPFRLSKSMLVSVFYPAWVWAQPETDSTMGGLGISS